MTDTPTVPDYPEAIRKLATAIVWTASGAIHELGSNLVQQIADKCREALDLAGVVGDD